MAGRRARLGRDALLSGGVYLLLVSAAEVGGSRAAVVLPAVAVLIVAILPGLVRTVERIIGYREVTPYSALADAAHRLRSPVPQDALPGLARVLAEGTRARRATVWLAVGERLVATASHPAADETDSAENLAVLLARPGLGHVVPVLDGTALRAVLSIEKPEAPVTPADRVLMHDVAAGAALLLRTVALNAELAERVGRADRLADELTTSRRRLARARETERRRLLTELSRATSGGLVALRAHVAAARDTVGDPAAAGAALVQARTEVDELLDRFRVIARGVHPAVLRSQGPGPALEELTADLRRPVRLTGDLDARVAWEIESAVYQVTAAALEVLAASPAAVDIDVRLTHGDGRIGVLVEDPAPPVTADEVRAALVDDIERLVALGGDVDCREAGSGGLRLTGWLPDRLDALFDVDEATA